MNICNQDCALFLRLYRVELSHSLRFCDHDVSVVGVCGLPQAIGLLLAVGFSMRLLLELLVLLSVVGGVVAA